MLRYIYTEELDESDVPNWFSVLYAVNQELLCELLGRDQLAINGEIEIWKAALRWADNQCHKNGKEITGENRREVLGPVLYKIRFPTISHEDFSRIIVPSAVLTEEELINVYANYSLPGEIAPIFPTTFRVINSCKLRQIGRGKFSATFSILSLNGELKNNRKDKVLYPTSAQSYGYGEFIGVSKLMNPSNGLYDKEADTVTLVIGVTSDEKKLHV
ncbi:hypothetical protein niasHS_015737 [Heterodera schachtii]|uniref:BACK domain-containing protein n=1 Tax=Heterodera schachtii TaxID=97005 RepID=A0ABD2HQ57_HETSC